MAHSEEHIKEEIETLYESLTLWSEQPQTAATAIIIADIEESIKTLEAVLLSDTASSVPSEVPGVFSLNLELCGVPTPPPAPEPECPPLCVPDPCASVNWIGSPNEEPFLNEAVCEYWVSITTEYPDLKVKTISEIMKEYTDPGIKLILNFVGKKTSDSIVTLVSKDTTTDNFVDFRSLAKIKVLVKIPVDTLAPLENKEEKSKDEMPDSANFPLTVVLTASDIRSAGSKFNIVKRAIGNKYSKQYEIGFDRQQLACLPTNILLKDEADRLSDFKIALIKLLKKQGFKINPALSNKKSGVLEAVEIGFKEKYAGIKYIKANNMGCDVKELGTTDDAGIPDGGPGWDSFLNKSSVNYPTTLAFVANLPSIYDSVTSDAPPSVDLFIKNYFYPPIVSTAIGQDLTLATSFVSENGCSPEELVMNLSRIITTPGLEVLGTALSLPELISKTFTEKACLTLEGKREQDKKINQEDEVEKRAKDVDLRKFYSGDPVFANLPKTLKEIANMDELYKEILNKLGVCGLSALAFEGLGCLLKGFDIELSMSLLVKTFIRNATDKEMESIFFSFHPSLQQFIRDSVLGITAIPLPWEAGYRPGSYQAAGVKYSFDTYGSGDVSGTGSIDQRIQRAKEQGSIITEQVDPESGDLQSFRARSKTSIKEQEEKFRSFTDIPLFEEDGKTPIVDKDGNQIVITSPEGVMPAPGLGPRSYAGPFAHAGSVGSALDGIHDNAIGALKEALTRAIEENIVSAESMMSFIDKLPLGKLLKNTIVDTLDCPLPPLFSPPLDDILKTLELDFCAGHYSVTLPVIPKLQVRPFLGDIWTILIEAAEEALEALVVRAITIILEKLLSFSLNLTCEVLKDAAGILKDIAGGSNFREIIAENLCGDSLNDAAVDAAFNQLNESLGSLGLPGVPKPDNSDMSKFIDGISAILTQEELLDFLDGNPSVQAISYAKQIIKGIPNLLAVLKTDEDIKNIFVGLGKVFDRNKIRDRVAASAFKPISPAICGSPEHLELFDEIRCGILREKGLTLEECKDQLDKLKEQAKCDFNDLADVVSANLFGNPEIVGSPNCPDTGIYPGEDPHTKKLTQELFDSNYEVINATFMKELLTKKGLLNMILADSRGAGFKKHNEFWVQIFGSALSKDFGNLDFYADEKVGQSSKALLDIAAFGGKPLGTYPETVASYLQNILADDLGVDYSDSSTKNITLAFDPKWDGSHPDKNDNKFPDWINVDYNYRFNNDKIIDMKISSEEDLFGPPLEYKVIKSYDSDIIDKISSLGAQSPDTAGKGLYIRNQEYVFGKLMASAWAGATINQSSDLENLYQTKEFPYITEKIIEKFARKISKNPRAFKFGYTTGATGLVIELDPEKYGGTEKNPAFYVEPPVHTGWLGLYDDLIPEVDGCSRKPILNFNSISAQTSEYSNKLADDPRMQFPAACVVDTERPFDRAMPRAALAGTDGAIMATVRLYVMEIFLKGLPAFSMFDPKFPGIYDDVLLSYITSNIKRGLLDTGINFRTKDSKKRYYYTFLEEVVQNFGKKVDLGLIIPTQSQINAMAKINEVQETWQKPKKKAIDTNYNKKVRDHMIYMIMSVENQCLVLLNYYVNQQITQVSQDFSNALGSSIPSLESWFFGSQTWMSLGSLKTQVGPMDVSLNPLNDLDTVVEKIKGMGDGNTLSTEPYSAGYFPFILEKYIKVRPISKTPLLVGRGLDPNDFQIYNFQELTNALTNNNTLATPIKENYGQWSYGLRISMVMSGETRTGIPDIDSFYNSIPGELAKRERSYKFGSSTAAGAKFVVPVATAEIPIPGETLGAQATSGFDINCMIAELINTAEYKTLFNYCFPLQSLLSLATIYTVETFILSIGEEWDDQKGKDRPGGATGSQFKTWDKEGSFKKTRKNLRRLFEGFYNSRDATYQDPEMETQEERTRKKLKVKRKLPTDKQIKWWKKRLQVPKPAEECKD